MSIRVLYRQQIVVTRLNAKFARTLVLRKEEYFVLLVDQFSEICAEATCSLCRLCGIHNM